MAETVRKGDGKNEHLSTSVYPAISSQIVTYLKDQGMTLKEIGSLIGMKEAFISRVWNKQRSFTLKHLSKLEKALNKPLPTIIIEATPVKIVPKKLRPAYRAFHVFLGELGEA